MMNILIPRNLISLLQKPLIKDLKGANLASKNDIANFVNKILIIK